LPPATMRAGGDAAAPQPAAAPAPVPESVPESAPEPVSAAAPQPQSLLEISELAEAQNDPLLAAHIRTHVRLVRMQPGLLDICLTDGAPDNLPGDMARRLSDWTGTRWMVSLSEGPGGMTIAEERRAAQRREIETVAETPLVKAITEIFPGATIESVMPLTGPEPDQPHTDQPNEEIPT
jgi:DNA polymerase-3 subunit gamma/tau